MQNVLTGASSSIPQPDFLHTIENVCHLIAFCLRFICVYKHDGAKMLAYYTLFAL